MGIFRVSSYWWRSFVSIVSHSAALCGFLFFGGRRKATRPLFTKNRGRVTLLGQKWDCLK